MLNYENHKMKHSELEVNMIIKEIDVQGNPKGDDS